MPTGNTQQQINYGASANDGQGDPLRTAFIKTDENFDNIWLAGPAGSNVRITNNTIGVLDTNGNLILSPNGVGVIQTNNTVVPRATRTYDLGSANLQYRTVYANTATFQTVGVAGDLSVSGNLTVQGNIIQVGNIVTETLTIQLANAATTGNAANGAGITVGANDNIATLLYRSTSNVWTTNIGLSATGNVTAPYFIGNGSQLTGLAATYGNSNVANFLAAYGSNTIATTGNVTGGNLLTSASVIASGVIQSGTGLSTGGYLSVDGTTDLHDTTVTGNLSVSVIRNDDSTVVKIEDGVDIDGDALVNGNVTADYFIGNGSQLTGLAATYGNANVVANLAALGTNPISTTGNITAGNIIATNLGNIAAVNLTGNANTVLYGNGTFALPAASSSYGNANVTALLGNLGSNVISGTGNITTTANISGAYIKGNGSELTNLPAPTVTQDITSNGAMSIMTYDGVIKYVNYATVEPSTGNIAGGNISAIGNIAGNYFIGDGSQLTGISASANTGNVTFDDVNVIGTGNLNLQPNGSASEYLNIYLTGAADIHVAYGGGSGNVILGTDEEANVAVLQGGNVAIQAGNVSGTKTWTFDTAGNLTLPMDSVVYETNIPDGALSGSAIALKPTGGTTVNQQLLIYPTANDGDHIHLTSGNLYATELFLGSDNLYVKLANTGNVVINSNDGNSSNAMWTFGTDGNLTVPGGIVGSGASPAPYLSGFSSVSAITLSASGNVTGGNLVTAGSGGAITMTGGNITGAGNISAGNISATGNITAANFFGNGNTLSNVATTFEGTWTVPTGNSTQSFTVNSGTYSMWVDCNIPNGILVWNATGTVTNTNVPVVGYQYAWVYNGGGTPIDFTSIPNQFIGTANAIVRSNTSPSATTNRFDFGINNTSGGNVTMRYGWAQIS